MTKKKVAKSAPRKEHHSKIAILGIPVIGATAAGVIAQSLPIAVGVLAATGAGYYFMKRHSKKNTR